MPPPHAPPGLDALFRAYARNVYAYARRHTTPDEAEDVVGETFLVACRRLDSIPSPALPWLLVVARHVISRQRRTGRRADALWLAAVRDLWQMPVTLSPEDAHAERETWLGALAACSRVEREALLLVAWDGLRPDDAARVAGCSTRAFTVRLSRARARLNRRTDQVAAAAVAVEPLRRSLAPKVEESR